jgi:type I restriction enzyme S subunit
MVKEEYNKVKLGPKKITVPSGWKIKDMKDLIKFKNGYAFSSNNYSENGKIVFRMSNINRKGNLNVNEENIKHCSEETYDELKRYHLAKDDLVICMTDMNSDLNILGRTGIIDKDNEYILNQRVGRMRVKNTDMVNFKYLHYFTNFKPYLDYIKATATGTAQYNTSTKTIKNTNVVLPPLFEQKKIASILSSVDKLIEKTDEVIEETKELKKGLMQELLIKGIGNSEFKKVNINGKTMSLPVNWDVKMLKNVTQINKNNISTSTPEDYEIEYIDISSINNIGKIKEITFYNYGNAPSRAKRLVNIDDVIVSTVRPYLKSFSIINEDKENLVCSTGFAVLTPKSNMETEYIYYFVWSNHFVNYMRRLMRGTSYPAVNKNDVANTFIPVPPLKEQKKIASILSSMDAKIKKEEEYKAKLERLKKGLMQKLLTGEIRVNTEMEV